MSKEAVMANQRWYGIDPTGKAVILVGIEYEEEDAFADKEVSAALNVFYDETFSVQEGDLAEALGAMYKRIFNQITTHKITHVAVKGAALSQQGTVSSIAMSSAVRGVVIAACYNAGAKTHIVNPATLSKNYGNRKTDEHLNDETFWFERVGKKVRKLSRKAAMQVLAGRELK